ncbi:hypothetical protein GCM10022243_26450 [Saccharothrix violaceirubra]|uniref:Uncharacterized protein n=1 Tax=Saccharothrix violaceirubra TaxID=413306 RepID=A0A7W7TAA4_9PSEU|nr:hypothetical protein [Saccharothrix violaceirubra]MBB4969433.1 hypothetical protein [Saccharothrix violaceirubra]
MTTWRPADEHESTAGWHLWLSLSTPLWPGPAWDGTAASAMAGLGTVLSACARLECTGPLSDLLHSAVFVGSLPHELWSTDLEPLDGERLALLHADLSGVADHFSHLRTVLATGGGWAELESR